MSDFAIKPATRQGVKPLVGFYGKSGSGKTLSALYFARGLAGQSGKIRLIDSENGRGSIFADIVPSGYDVLDLEPPFSPDRYIAAIAAAESGADVVVVDSLSHEWSGEAGVLDMQDAELDRMAGDDWKKRDQCKMAAWIKPKMAHKQMVMRLLRCKCAVICCLRGEEKTHMAKMPDGKNKPITDEFSSPLFDPRFIFEMLLNFETIARNGIGGFVVPRKITHPDIGRLLPGPDQQISIAHGEALARWCQAAGSPTPKPATQTAEDPIKTYQKQLWNLCKDFRGTEKSWARVESQLVSWNILSNTQTIKDLSAAELEEVISKLEVQLTLNTENQQ